MIELTLNYEIRKTIATASKPKKQHEQSMTFKDNLKRRQKLKIRTFSYHLFVFHLFAGLSQFSFHVAYVGDHAASECSLASERNLITVQWGHANSKAGMGMDRSDHGKV